MQLQLHLGIENLQQGSEPQSMLAGTTVPRAQFLAALVVPQTNHC